MFCDLKRVPTTLDPPLRRFILIRENSHLARKGVPSAGGSRAKSGYTHPPSVLSHKGEIRQGKGCLSITAESGSDDREQLVEFLDREQLPLAFNPPFWCPIKTKASNLADVRIDHEDLLKIRENWADLF